MRKWMIRLLGGATTRTMLEDEDFECEWTLARAIATRMGLSDDTLYIMDLLPEKNLAEMGCAIVQDDIVKAQDQADGRDPARTNDLASRPPADGDG